MLSTLVLCLLSAPRGEFSLPDAVGTLHACVPAGAVIALTRPAAQRLLAPGADDDLTALFQGCGARVLDRCDALGLVRVRLVSGEDLPSACVRILAMPEVRQVEPDWLGEGGYLPSDPGFPGQWHLSDVGDHDIDAPEAWEITRGSSEVVVALLDTG